MEEITFEHIIRYLENGLSDDETNRLEGLAQEDSALASRIEEAKQLLRGIRRSGEKEVEENVKSFHVDFKSTADFRKLAENTVQVFGKKQNIKIVKLVSKYKWISLAAAILLLIFVGVSIFKTPGEEKLFANYYFREQIFLKSQVEYLERTGMASTDAERRAALKKALTQYNIQDFKTSHESLRQYLIDFPSDSVALLYLALNKIEKKEYESAIKILKDLTATNQQDIIGIVNWYLALLYIKTNRLVESKQLLMKVANDSRNQYAEKAKELLTKIDSK
ncbi:MAG: hypothetical protein ABJC12_02445 [Saprospiraceae bacterium]